MPQVTVTIAGRTYRMACGDGEEQHLEGLAALFDGKIEEMRKSFGEIGDMRLHVMAAITIADELADTRRRMAALEGEVAALRAAVLGERGDRRQRDERAGKGPKSRLRGHLRSVMSRSDAQIRSIA